MSTVLAVEDEPDVLALLQWILGRAGHSVEVASSAERALEILRARPVDLVLIDVMMPERDGFSLLEEIKSDPELAHTPAMMVTARTDDIDRFRGGLEGALFYITKPFDPWDLVHTVGEVLGAGTPEPVRRRDVQRRSLERLAALESGRPPHGARPRLSALSQGDDHERRGAVADSPATMPSRARLNRLTSGQLALLRDLARAGSVSSLAHRMGVSRQAVYARLRRIDHKLGTGSARSLIHLAREIVGDAGPRG